MKYKEAMNKKCFCGRQNVGGWQGTPRKGDPLFSKVTIPVITEIGGMVEIHTITSCWMPCRINSLEVKG